MAWTTPRTFSTGEVVTASMMNEQIRDNSTFLHSRPTCVLTRSALQSIPNNTITNVLYTVERVDSDAFHSTASQTDRITIPASAGAGWYRVYHRIAYFPNSAGDRMSIVQKNGTGEVDRIAVRATANANSTIIGNAKPILLAVGDFLIHQAYQDSGVALDCQFFADRTPEFGVEFMRGA